MCARVLQPLLFLPGMPGPLCPSVRHPGPLGLLGPVLRGGCGVSCPPLSSGSRPARGPCWAADHVTSSVLCVPVPRVCARERVWCLCPVSLSLPSGPAMVSCPGDGACLADFRLSGGTRASSEAGGPCRLSCTRSLMPSSCSALVSFLFAGWWPVRSPVDLGPFAPVSLGCPLPSPGAVGLFRGFNNEGELVLLSPSLSALSLRPEDSPEGSGNQQFFGDLKPGHKPGTQGHTCVCGCACEMTLPRVTLGRSPVLPRRGRHQVCSNLNVQVTPVTLLK